MSRPSEQGSAPPEDGDPHRPPNVYLPQPPQSPAYDAYADPAAAHGWQDTAYDDTAQLPPVAADAPAQRSGHRGRHRPLGLRSRRVLVAAGAVGAVSLTAVIAAFSFSGSPSGGARGGPERTGATAGDSVSPTGAESSPGTLADRPGSSGAASPRKSASPSATSTADVTDSTREPSTATTSTAPSSSAATNTSAAAPSYSRDHPGKGQGNTKKPD
ncbi:hypothetical protein [Streptomyces sp. GESEQ-4]|uniref:hypothetical protein n=1 Tax=Streptomyces sp. GESEQ-4 TaxID=2812655 RepID=UPI001B321027|nr:hypothetical protein [Streptomyces sp. GESEQ-4]